MKNKTGRKAVRNLAQLQASFDATKTPSFQLRQDLENAKAALETVKARKEARLEARVTTQLVEAKKEADQALKASNKAKRAARRAKKTAKESRQRLRPHRGEHASKSILEVAESREEEDRLALFDGENAYAAAEKQLYDANAKVFALQGRLSLPAQDSQDSK